MSVLAVAFGASDFGVSVGGLEASVDVFGASAVAGDFGASAGGFAASAGAGFAASVPTFTVSDGGFDVSAAGGVDEAAGDFDGGGVVASLPQEDSRERKAKIAKAVRCMRRGYLPRLGERNTGARQAQHGGSATATRKLGERRQVTADLGKGARGRQQPPGLPALAFSLN